MDRSSRFGGKSVIVTGAGMGIGRGAAIAFAREGGGVVAADIDPAAADDTVREITSAGGRAIAVRCDVSKSSDVQKMVADGVRGFGGIDIVFNNAGINLFGRVDEMSEEDWDRQINVNLKSVFLVCKYAIPEMRKRGGGAIVNNASVQAFASQMSCTCTSGRHGLPSLVIFISPVVHARPARLFSEVPRPVPRL